MSQCSHFAIVRDSRVPVHHSRVPVRDSRVPVHHSRVGGNPVISRTPLDSRLRGNDLCAWLMGPSITPNHRHVAPSSIAQHEDRCEYLFAFLTFFDFYYALFATCSVLVIGRVQTQPIAVKCTLLHVPRRNTCASTKVHSPPSFLTHLFSYHSWSSPCHRPIQCISSGQCWSCALSVVI